MNTRRPHLVVLGLDQFPIGLAETQRARLIGKALVESGCNVTVICRWWTSHRWGWDQNVKAEGSIDGVGYVNSSGVLFRPESWVRRKVLRIKGMVYEIINIHKIHHRHGVAGAIISSQDFLSIVYYRILAKVYGFPLVLNLVEMQSAITGPRFLEKANAALFDRFAGRFVDGILAISDLLLEHVRERRWKVERMKVPVLVDLERFSTIVRNPREKYILFCGSTIYFEVLQFVLDVFDKHSSATDVKLYLVVSGSRQGLRRLEAEIARHLRKEDVKIFSDLSDEDLAELYANSHALLIPLRPSIQDAARFPHKIGEYCASRRPVVTTNYGEVKKYFEDGRNAFVASTYDIDEFANTLDRAIDNAAGADLVGSNGRVLAEQEFSHALYGTKIKGMFDQLGKVP